MIVFVARRPTMDESSWQPAGRCSANDVQRRLGSMLRHGQQTVRMALATVTHQSSSKVHTACGAPRSQTTATRASEEEVHEAYVVPREQKRPPPGERPAPLLEVAGPQAAVTVGYVAAEAPSLVVAPVAAHDGLDDATVQFLLAQTLLAKQQEDEEVRQAEELREWEDKIAKSKTRIVEEVDRRLGDRSDLTTLLKRVSTWYLNRNEVLKRKEKRKKKKKKKKKKKRRCTRRTRWRRSWSLHSCRPSCLLRFSILHGFYGPLYLAVTCSMWFLPDEYSTCLFWEKASGKCRIQRFLV